jgi:hypothetical protein
MLVRVGANATDAKVFNVIAAIVDRFEAFDYPRLLNAVHFLLFYMK